VLAVKCTEPLPPPSGPPMPAARLAERIPPACWLRISAGWGAKGRRWSAWSRVALASAGAPDGWGRWLLLRRSPTTRGAGVLRVPRPGRPAAGRPGPGRRNPLAGEEAFQVAKGLCGLDQRQVRRWHCWSRWVALAMLAYAFLVVTAVTEHHQRPAPQG